MNEMFGERIDKKILSALQGIESALIQIAGGGNQSNESTILNKLAELESKINQVLTQQENMMADLTAEFAAFGAALDRAVAEINSEITDLAAALANNAAATAVVEDARAKITAATARISGVADALAADNPPAPTPAPEPVV